jgi:hypothetical protein
MNQNEWKERLELEVKSCFEDEAIKLNLRRALFPYDYSFHHFFIKDEVMMKQLVQLLTQLIEIETFEITTSGYVNIKLSQSHKEKILLFEPLVTHETYLRMKFLDKRLSIEAIKRAEKFEDEKFATLMTHLQTSKDILEQYTRIQTALDQESMRMISRDEKMQWRRIFYLLIGCAEN